MNQFSPAHLARMSAPAAVPDVDELTRGVAEAVAGLSELGRTSTVEHVQIFESVHQVLSDTLSTVDDA